MLIVQSPSTGWRRTYALFAVFLAFAALFHVEAVPVLWGGGSLWLTGLTLALVLAAVAVLASPGDGRRLVIMCVAQLATFVAALPEVGGDWLLATIVSLTIVTSAAWRVIVARWTLGSRGAPLDVARLMASASPALRLGTGAFYAFACLWKLNRGFVNPDVSCAVRGYTAAASALGLPAPAGMRVWLVAVTLVVLGAAPLLLLRQTTRAYAALAMVLFHACVGLDVAHRNLGLSTVMFALLVLGVSSGQMESRAARVCVRWVLRWLAPGGAIVWPPFLFTVIVTHRRESAAALFEAGRCWAFLIYALVTIGIIARLATVRNPPGPPLRARPGESLRAPALWPVAWLCPALVVLVGVGPLLGTRTRGGWQMNSNLRLEPDASNHLIFGRSLDIFGLMRDRVELLSTSDGALAAALVGTGLSLPFVTFRQQMLDRPEAAVTYRNRGREFAVARAGTDPVLSRPLPWFARAMLFLSPMGDSVVHQCVW